MPKPHGRGRASQRPGQEIGQALGVSGNGVVRVLRNIYGLTTAPTRLWLSLNRALVGGFEAKPVLGKGCLGT